MVRQSHMLECADHFQYVAMKEPLSQTTVHPQVGLLHSTEPVQKTGGT
jgi:hypothetical protein